MVAIISLPSSTVVKEAVSLEDSSPEEDSSEDSCEEVEASEETSASSFELLPLHAAMETVIRHADSRKARIFFMFGTPLFFRMPPL